MLRDIQIEEAQTPSTQLDHHLTVERVVQFMNEHFAAALSLDDLADVAGFSPYYFCRVFHNSIGIPPGEFLSSLRLAAAKRLLLTTTRSVTDICFDVGYCGLGSFTTRFSQLVGVSPRLFRMLAQENVQFADEEPVITSHPMEGKVRGGLAGYIHGPATFNGVIFAGLFPKPIPQGRPVSCTMLTSPGMFHISQVPTGKYFLLVAAFPRSSDPHVYLLPHDSLLVASAGPIFLREGAASEPVSLTLRSLRHTDPPLISALPFL
ncbi:MAG TPA: AraC family transcriptional regulator [Ktedonobacteraceae bacterium]|jgi:AraC-like DNA-binding protein